MFVLDNDGKLHAARDESSGGRTYCGREFVSCTKESQGKSLCVRCDSLADRKSGTNLRLKTASPLRLRVPASVEPLEGQLELFKPAG